MAILELKTINFMQQEPKDYYKFYVGNKTNAYRFYHETRSLFSEKDKPVLITYETFVIRAFVPPPEVIIDRLIENNLIQKAKCQCCSKEILWLTVYERYCFNCNNIRIKNKKISKFKKAHPFWNLFGTFFLSCDCAECFVKEYDYSVKIYKVPKVPNA